MKKCFLGKKDMQSFFIIILLAHCTLFAPFSHIKFGMITILVIYGVIDLRISSNVLS